MVRLAQVIESMDKTWPLLRADDWDNVGLQVGDLNTEIRSALLTVDVTSETMAEAVAKGVQLVISHHPLLLRGLMNVNSNTAIGSVIHTAIKNGVAIVSLHTNADHPQFGVSESLALSLGLSNLQPLETDSGHGRVGEVTPRSLKDFVEFIASVLPNCGAPLRVAGAENRVVQRVAVLAGAGGSFLQLALAARADVFVTSDLKHHQALDFLSESRAASEGCALVDISHWAAESLWLPTAANQLGMALPHVTFEVSEQSTDPWTFSLQS